ncbi:restriction endonuclease subunit S [Photobacterium leiognathi]|uniref:restriction endonuclease subunit S n=1 Tax=Photobacterium leiognathi TaxID=553611 RepID=UPI002980B848|nr:restriction endonuclease subunit S [Photobacterium leiognathi]
MGSQTLPVYKDYLDTNLEWLDQIPKGWSLKKLKNFSSLKARVGFHGLSSSDFIDSGVYCVTGTDFRLGSVDFNSCYFVSEKWYEMDKNIQLQNGDVLITKDGTIGKTAMVEGLTQQATLNSGVFVLRPSIVSKYLYWLLNSRVFVDQVDIISRGSTINHLYERDFKDFVFPVPSESEQLQIVDFLDSRVEAVDSVVELKEKQIELLKERKQIIIQQAVTQGLNPDVPMKNSNVDWTEQIPEHWQMKRVKNIFKMVMEAAGKNNSHELLSVYSDIGVKPRKELEERGNKASSTDGYWMVKSGDIIVNKLLAWMGAIGLSEYDGVTSPAYDILRPRIEVDGYFYHLLFRAKFFSAELKRHSRGIMDMRLRLYFDKFGVLEVPYPPIEEQREIVKFVKRELSLVDDGISLFEQQINKLKEYKTTLINSAVTGKIKVTEQV